MIEAIGRTIYLDRSYKPCSCRLLGGKHVNRRQLARLLSRSAQECFNIGNDAIRGEGEQNPYQQGVFQ